MTVNIRHPLIALTLLLVLLGRSGLLTAQVSEQEYFVRQDAGEAVLIRVDGEEALFSSRVQTIENELLVNSSVPGSRLAPLFQYIRDTPDGRQLDITVTAQASTSRSQFTLGLSRINVHDQRSARLAQAYEWLGFGLESPPADTTANWSIRVNALLNAGRLFQEFGMDELRLWAKYYRAQLTLRELGDANSAQQLSAELLADPRSQRDGRMQLAAQQLRTEALAAMRDAGTLAENGFAVDGLQVALSERLELAVALGAQFERADTLNLSGEDYALRGLFSEALERFQSALNVAESVAADDLATTIRESLVDIHGQQGNVAATSEVLQAIESQLSEDGAGDELAQNLLAQGQLYNRNFRHREAAQVLGDALGFENNSATRAQVRLALARAWYELGQWDLALEQVRAVVVNPSSGQFRRRTPLLDIAAGLGILADIYRQRGQQQAMAEAREAQRRALMSPAERTRWNWSKAQDLLRTTANDAGAVPLLRSVIASAGSASMAHYADLARLELCRMGSDCSTGTGRAAWAQLQRSTQPRTRAAGQLLWAELLRERGQSAAARRVYEELVDELGFLQYELPGVLGAWYWQQGERAFQGYLELALAAGNAADSWRAVTRVRWVRASVNAATQPETDAAPANDYRTWLASASSTNPGAPAEALSAELRETLGDYRQQHEAATGFLDADVFRASLRNVPDNAVLLDFHLTGRQSWLFWASGQQLRQIPLRTAGMAEETAGFIRSAGVLSGDAFDRLMRDAGNKLLGPVASDLPEQLLLVSSMSILGLPVDALSPGAEALVQRHQLSWVVDFPRWLSRSQLSNDAPRFSMTASEPRVFLAGQPSDFTSDFLDRLALSQEMRVVMEAFVGPGLQVVQGAALLGDEFLADEFRRADILHLEMPGVIDLEYPQRSYLELSEERRGLGRQKLQPAAMGNLSSQATLAFLSQTRVGRGVALNGNVVAAPGGDGRPAMVRELLESGVGQVIASLWTGEDQESAALVAEFYRALGESGDVAQALAQAKRRSSLEQTAQGSRGWARFQLFVN